MTAAERFIEVMRLATRQAGAVSLYLQGEVLDRGKEGSSPEAAALTAVDLAAQDILLLALRSDFGHVSLDAEEDTPLAASFPAGQDDLIVLDPIDGTYNYVHGSPDFAVMGSLLHRGTFEASILHFPRHDFTAWALRGGGCWRQKGDGPVEPVRLPLPAPDDVLISPHLSPAQRATFEQAGLRPIDCRCSAFDSTAPALGFATAAFSHGSPDRRRAIGFLLTQEAGGTVWIGDRPWKEEDTEGPGRREGPNVVAASGELAARILAAWSQSTAG